MLGRKNSPWMLPGRRDAGPVSVPGDHFSTAARERGHWRWPSVHGQCKKQAQCQPSVSKGVLQPEEGVCAYMCTCVCVHMCVRVCVFCSASFPYLGISSPPHFHVPYAVGTTNSGEPVNVNPPAARRKSPDEHSLPSRV